MSGDVQPRKRKDKRKKKEDEDILTPTKHPTDEIIHIHKESSLGGNVCTKFIFFCLLGALGVMISFSILEYRGTSDEDHQSVVDSPWSVMFQDWANYVPDFIYGDTSGDHHDDALEHSDKETDHGDTSKEEIDEEHDSAEEEHGSPEEEDHEKLVEEEDHDEVAASEEEKTEDKSSGWFSFLNFYGSNNDKTEEEAEGDLNASGEETQEEAEEEAGEEEEEEEEEPGYLDDEENDESAENMKGSEEQSGEEDENLNNMSEEEEDISEEKEDASEEQTDLSEEQEISQEDEEDDGIGSLTSQEDQEPEDQDEFEPEEQDGNEQEDQGEHTVEEHEESGEVPQESEEEMFPEAIEALRREREELGLQEDEKEEAETPDTIETDTVETEEEKIAVNKDEESSGAENVESVNEAPAPLGHEPVVISAPEPKPQRVEEIKDTPPPPPKIPIPESIPIRNEPEEEIEYEEEDEEEEEEVEVEDMGQGKVNEITAKKYEQLLAQYGQMTPDSSDAEQSDDDAMQREYSDGAEEESVGEEESGNDNAEISEPEEEQAQHWTNIKRSDVQLDSEDEEEESEDDAPPVVSRRPAGGPKEAHQEYENWDITNEDDWEIRGDLDRADEELNNHRTQVALNKYAVILEKHPESPRARYGKARALDKEAESKRSNIILNQAIEAYLYALTTPRIPDALLLKLATRAIDRIQFRGLHMKAIPVYDVLIKRFNDTPRYMNGLAVNYLMMNRLDDGGEVFKTVLEKWPEDAMAQAHYGLVLKLQGKNKESLPFLESGLAVDIPETRDARLYFHLGDALSRSGRSNDAVKVYEKAVDKGLFRSKYQRSLYNVDRLIGRPWWTIQQTTYADFFKKLEVNWKVIRDEGIAALKSIGGFKDETENLRDVGDWKQFELFSRGMKYAENCRKTPITCSIISEFEPARTCKRGQSKFSVMEAGTHVWPHCGPTNCRLRAHLGLVVPPGTSIRVAETTGTWKEGKVIVFDDSFEHEVWHNGTSLRLVLIVDVWHPELTKQERLSLSPI